MKKVAGLPVAPPNAEATNNARLSHIKNRSGPTAPSKGGPLTAVGGRGKVRGATPASNEAIPNRGKAEVSMPVITQDHEPSALPMPTARIPGGKLGILVDLLHHPDGATLGAMMAATGWQAHSVRGAMAGAIKKKLSFPITSEKLGTIRIWRIAGDRA